MATPVRDEWLDWGFVTEPHERGVSTRLRVVPSSPPPGAASKMHTMAVRILLFIFPTAALSTSIGQIFGVISVESFLPAINTVLGAVVLIIAKRVFKTYMVGREVERERELAKRRKRVTVKRKAS